MLFTIYVNRYKKSKNNFQCFLQFICFIYSKVQKYQVHYSIEIRLFPYFFINCKPVQTITIIFDFTFIVEQCFEHSDRLITNIEPSVYKS